MMRAPWNFTLGTPNSNVHKLLIVLSGSNMNKLGPPTGARVGLKLLETPSMFSNLCCGSKY